MGFSYTNMHIYHQWTESIYKWNLQKLDFFILKDEKNDLVSLALQHLLLSIFLSNLPYFR